MFDSSWLILFNKINFIDNRIIKQKLKYFKVQKIKYGNKNDDMANRHCLRNPLNVEGHPHNVFPYFCHIIFMAVSYVALHFSPIQSCIGDALKWPPPSLALLFSSFRHEQNCKQTKV